MASEFDFLFDEDADKRAAENPLAIAPTTAPPREEVAAPPASEFNFLFEKPDVSEAGVVRAGTLSPDDAVKASKLSKASNIPESVVSRNIPTVEKKMADAALRKAMRESPAIKTYAERGVDYLATIADDVVELLTVDTAVNSLRSFGSAIPELFGRGLSGLGEANRSAGNLLADVVSFVPDAILGDDVVRGAFSAPVLPRYLNPTAVLKDPGEMLKAVAKSVGPADAEKNLVTDVAGGLGQFVSQATLYVVAPWTALAFLFGQGADQQADKIEKAKVDPNSTEASVAVLSGGAVT